jgi:hypothetical protein
MGILAPLFIEDIWRISTSARSHAINYEFCLTSEAVVKPDPRSAEGLAK